MDDNKNNKQINQENNQNDLTADHDCESDIELDPEYVIYNGQEKGSSEPISEPPLSEPQQFRPPEDPFNTMPVAPQMPQINNAPYVPTEIKNNSRGMKVFAIIVALLVLLSACVTVGYFIGNSNSGTAVKNFDLAQKPTPENAKTGSEVYNIANKSVVGIYVYNNDGVGCSASGVVYSENGYVITNDHIYKDIAAAKFKIYTYDGKTFDASYVAGDIRSDLAVLKIKDPTGLTPAVFGDSSQLVVGESVLAVGRPNGASESSSASEGIVSSVDRRIATTTTYLGKYIQTDAAINPGNSGGALYNLYGQVVGITSVKISDSQNQYEGLGFAIPTTVAKSVVESLIKNKRVIDRAKLGISYFEMNELNAQIKNLPCGLQISEIDKSSDLYGKSVKAGDIITHVNGEKITGSYKMLDVIEAGKPGDTITLAICSADGKNSFDITVKLLEDKGSTSYTTEKSAKNSSGNSSGFESKEYNNSQFNFPNGD